MLSFYIVDVNTRMILAGNIRDLLLSSFCLVAANVAAIIIPMMAITNEQLRVRVHGTLLLLRLFQGEDCSGEVVSLPGVVLTRVLVGYLPCSWASCTTVG